MRNIYFRAGLLLFFFAFGKISWAQQAQLLKDINPHLDKYDGRIVHFNTSLAAGKHIFFNSGSCFESPELYAIDTENDSLIMPINIEQDDGLGYYCGIDPAFFWDRPLIIGTLGEKVFFSTYQQDIGKELWVSDGTTEGSHLLKDLNPGYTSSYYYYGASFKNHFWFTESAGALGYKFYCSDGTEDGTKQIQDIFGGNGLINRVVFAQDNHYLYFITRSTSAETKLWRTSDGDAEIELLAELNDISFPSHLQIVDGNLYVIVSYYNSNNIYTNVSRIDTADYTVTLLQNFTYPSNLYRVVPNHFYPMNGKVYFVGMDSNNKEKLWETDGTATGTKSLPDIPLWVSPSSEKDLHVYKDRLHFLVRDGSKYQLARFDGNPGNLHYLQEFQQEPYWSAGFTESDGKLWWLYRGQQIWHSDGTITGTRMVADSMVQPRMLTSMGDKTFVLAGGKGVNYTFWRMSAQNNYEPVPVKGNPRANLSSDMSHFAVLKDAAYFWAEDTLDNGEVYKTTGLAGNAQKVTNLSFHPSVYSYEHNFAGAGSNILFTTYGPGNQRNIWAAGASPGDESPIFTMPQNGWGIKIQGAPGGQIAFFTGNSKNLHVTDGTVAGTSAIASGVNNFTNPLEHQGRFYMNVLRGDSVVWLLSTNGTAEGTIFEYPVMRATYLSDKPLTLKLSDYLIYFKKGDDNKWNIWKTLTDPPHEQWVATIDVPQDFLPYHVVAAGNVLYFTARISNYNQLWRTDGTTNGTFQIIPRNGPPAFNAIYNTLAFNGRLYFSANSAEYGTELWVSDGSADGTYVLKDIIPGNRSSSPQLGEAAALGNYFWFPAFTEQYGEEIWQSDGTPEGTRLVADICPGPCSGQPKRLKIIDNRHLLFSAYTPETGIEPWTLDVLKLNEPPVLRGPACRIDVQVAPNPATTSATLYFPDNTGQIARYQTLDATGKTTAEGSIAPSAVSIDIHLQGVPNGLYFIQLLDQSGEVLCTQRLVVQQ